MSYSVNQSMNDKAVCRTAPATPGLLITTNKYQSYDIILIFLKYIYIRHLKENIPIWNVLRIFHI